MATTPAPKGLDASGRKLWKDVTSAYKLRADELRVLESACRETDLLARLEEQMPAEELIVTGSQGQPVINPLVPELRQHRTTLAALLRQLKLPDANDTSEARSTQARAAANARWATRGRSA
ncbi:hypothetical protein [Nocardia transvalensis]|uniref:hypothetical protein n=1 Tax=Nocardia transvalensis TaxID=37333 RepID=UPI001896059F|nr:hypothetical protein [Nocardia transvalensis]MBF6328744.1 hypothetical protein [Nocardia transvalensis]